MAPAHRPLSALALALALGTAVGCGGGETKTDTPKPANTGQAALPDDKNNPHDTSIDVESNQVCEILIDGKSVGKTPLMGLKIAPGQHDITFIDPDGDRRTLGVDITEGDHKSIRSDVPPKIREQDDPKKKK